jgi:hypothetical protein
VKTITVILFSNLETITAIIILFKMYMSSSKLFSGVCSAVSVLLLCLCIVCSMIYIF